jgi:hypothetical protein
MAKTEFLTKGVEILEHHFLSEMFGAQASAEDLGGLDETGG